MLAATTGLIMETSLSRAGDDRNPPAGRQLQNPNNGETPANGGRRRGRGNRGRRGPGHHSPPPIIAALDTDADGVISSSEIDRAVIALKTLDKNGDGNITVEELRPERAGHGGAPEGGPGQRRRGGPEGDEFGRPGPPEGGPGQRRNRGPEGDDFGQSGPPEGGPGQRRNRSRGEGPSPEKLVEKLMESDTDGDGLISRDEASDRLLRGFDRIDSDGNGSIDKLEIEQMAKRITERRGGRRRHGNRGQNQDEHGGRHRKGKKPAPNNADV